MEDYVGFGGTLDGSQTLERLSDWLETSEASYTMPPYDHIMLATA